MPEVETSAFDGPLAEFVALRAEILQSLQMQWNIFALQLTAIAVTFSFSLSSKSRTGFLLIIPVVTYTLSNQYVRNYLRMERLGTYIREELSSRIPGGLGWQDWRLAHKGNYTSLFGRLGFVAPYPMIFPTASALAIAWTGVYIWITGHFSNVDWSLLAVIWVFNCIFTVISFYSIRFNRPYWVRKSADRVPRGL
jgi:hypothetical protein